MLPLLLLTLPTLLQPTRLLLSLEARLFQPLDNRLLLKVNRLSEKLLELLLQLHQYLMLIHTHSQKVAHSVTTQEMKFVALNLQYLEKESIQFATHSHLWIRHGRIIKPPGAINSRLRTTVVRDQRSSSSVSQEQPLTISLNKTSFHCTLGSHSITTQLLSSYRIVRVCPTWLPTSVSQSRMLSWLSQLISEV